MPFIPLSIVEELLRSISGQTLCSHTTANGLNVHPKAWALVLEFPQDSRPQVGRSAELVRENILLTAKPLVVAKIGADITLMVM
jgi:hypothetical protein